MREGSMSLGTLFDEVRLLRAPPLISIYAATDCGPGRDPDTPVFVAGPPTFDAAGQEVLPAGVGRAGLDILCSGDLVHDVVHHALKRKPGIGNEQLAAAFDHYMEEDDFMPIG